MAIVQTQKKCRDCGRKTLHAKERWSDGAHILITIVTLGLWIPFWLLMGLADMFTAFRCQLCGRRN